MDYFTSAQIVKSVVASVVFGLLYSVFLTLCSVLWQALEVCVRSFIKAAKYTGEIRDVRLLFFCINDETKKTKGKVGCIIFDFLKVLAFGISFSILLYVTQDGIFRLYVLAIALSVSYFSERLIGKQLYIILTKPVLLIVSIATSAAALVLIFLKRAYAAVRGFISLKISTKKTKKSVFERETKNKVEKRV